MDGAVLKDARSGRVHRAGGFLKFAGTLRMTARCSLVLGLILLRPVDALSIFELFESAKQESRQDRPAEVPPEYKGKHLPAGWGSDPKVLEAGKAIYEGKTIREVNCADCHGLDGKPTRKGKGAQDLTDLTLAKQPDDELFWKVSEGVPRTKMRGWKKYLTEDQRWQVIAYVRAFAQIPQRERRGP